MIERAWKCMKSYFQICYHNCRRPQLNFGIFLKGKGREGTNWKFLNKEGENLRVRYCGNQSCNFYPLQRHLMHSYLRICLSIKGFKSTIFTSGLKKNKNNSMQSLVSDYVSQVFFVLVKPPIDRCLIPPPLPSWEKRKCIRNYFVHVAQDSPNKEMRLDLWMGECTMRIHINIIPKIVFAIFCWGWVVWSLVYTTFKGGINSCLLKTYVVTMYTQYVWCKFLSFTNGQFKTFGDGQQ